MTWLGSSLLALVELGLTKGYCCVGVTLFNAFFIHHSLYTYLTPYIDTFSYFHNFFHLNATNLYDDDDNNNNNKSDNNSNNNINTTTTTTTNTTQKSNNTNTTTNENDSLSLLHVLTDLHMNTMSTDFFQTYDGELLYFGESAGWLGYNTSLFALCLYLLITCIVLYICNL